MGNEIDENGNSGPLSMYLSAEKLRGKQSVRVTFKLPLQVIELLGIAAGQLGLKQKSLFDQLIEDRAVLEQVALGAGNYQPLQTTRQQKTYVVSRSAMTALDQVAKAYRLPRNLLVEISIQRLVPVMSSEQEKQKSRQMVHKEMIGFLDQGKNLLHKTRQLLGVDDPTTKRLAQLVSQLQEDAGVLCQRVEHGKKIEAYG